jgi:hypothetical protein
MFSQKGRFERQSVGKCGKSERHPRNLELAKRPVGDRADGLTLTHVRMVDGLLD